MKKLKFVAIVTSILAIGNYFHVIHSNIDQFQFTDDLASNEQMFQPADGSMINGSYISTHDIAKTTLHTYNNIIVVDGTITTPTLSGQGKYLNEKSKLLDPIGSFSLYSEDSGNTNTYYMFGTIADSIPLKKPVENEPIETYTSPSD